MKNYLTVYSRQRLRLLKLLKMFDTEIEKGRKEGHFNDLEGVEEIGFWQGLRYARMVLKDLNIKIYELGKRDNTK